MNDNSAMPTNWWADIPLTVKRILLSVLLGAVAFVVTTLSGAHPSLYENLTFAILIAGLAVVVQFLGDVEKRLTSVEDKSHSEMEHIERDLARRFSELNSATALFSAIEASAFETDLMTQLVRNATDLGSNVPKLVRNFAQAEITRYSRFFKELSDGTVTYEGEDRDWLLALTRASTTSIWATSLTTVDSGGKTFDGGFWLSDLGQRYLEAQEEANGERQVEIRRIFVLDRKELRTDHSFINIRKQQERIGIEIRILDTSQLNLPTRTPLFDFIIFDRTLSYEMTPSSIVQPTALPMILETTLETYPPKIEERVKRFEDLWEQARPD